MSKEEIERAFDKFKLWLIIASTSLLVTIGGILFGIVLWFQAESFKYTQSVELTRAEHQKIIKLLENLE